MAQASVLTDAEIRRVFRIIETTRHAERNRLAFVLSIYTGLRVGEVAALTIGDVATRDGSVRWEIKLGAHQTKGLKGRTVVLSTRVRTEVEAFLKTRSLNRPAVPLIASQRHGGAFSNVTLSMMFKEIYETCGSSNLFPFRKAHICDATERKGRWNEDDPKTDGSSSHRDDCLFIAMFQMICCGMQLSLCEIER